MIDERQLENLARTEDNGKPLNQFSNNGWQIQIFKEILEDFNGDLTLAEMKSQAHKIHPHWKIVDSIIDGKKKSWTIHPEKYVLDRLDYKEMLWKRVKPILDAFLFSKEECDRLKSAIM